MYPQTHIYFAEKVLARENDSVALGSVFPDMIIGRYFNHLKAHSRGAEIYRYLRNNGAFSDFRDGVVTHGFDPKGLDYYGDEKYLDYERGYCFERGRPFVLATVMACNIPYEMGWWKAHNIIEMGVELLVGLSGHYGEKIKRPRFRLQITAWLNLNVRYYGFVGSCSNGGSICLSCSADSSVVDRSPIMTL